MRRRGVRLHMHPVQHEGAYTCRGAPRRTCSLLALCVLECEKASCFPSPTPQHSDHPPPLQPFIPLRGECVCVCLQARTRIISPCSMLALFKSIISPSTGSIQRGSGALRSCPLNGCLCPPHPCPHPAHPHFSVDSFDASVKMRRPRGNNGRH